MRTARSVVNKATSRPSSARHYPEIVRYLSARLGSRDDALELASEVFAEAWRRVPGLQWRGRPVRAWLYRVAANLAADELRRRPRMTALTFDVAGVATRSALVRWCWGQARRQPRSRPAGGAA